MPDKYEKDMTVLMKAAAEVKVSSKKLKRYVITQRKVSALLLVYSEDNFPTTSPGGAYIWRGDLTEGFSRYRIGGLIFWGAYTWRGLFSEFYGIKLSIAFTSNGKREFIPYYQVSRHENR